MSNYLNLNKSKIKKSVVSKLNILGYEVNGNTTVREIQKIIKTIQKNNKLVADGYIGRKTMQLLGYTYNEIRKMLKLPKHTDNSRCILYPFWLLFC